MKELTVQELDELVRQHADFQLVDVREPFEHAISNIGGDLIPLGQIISSSHKFSRDKKVVVYCRSGRRSADAIRELEKRFGYKNLYNLKGGILAWSKEIDHKKKGQSSKRAAENAPNGCLIKKILSLPKSVFRYFFKDGSRR
jgi:adenylyltransferase/sulfurtransferase